MRPIDQTKFGVPEGNCFAACVASLLRLPIDAIELLPHDGTWFDAFTRWLRPRGLYPIIVGYGDEWTPSGFYILSGQSPRGDFLHSVVAKGRSIVHDPHPSRAGILTRQDCIILAPIDMGEFDRRPADTFYIFDADATLRRCTVRDQACPNKPGEWESIPWAKERLAQIDWSRNRFGIVSNQGGVALGYLTKSIALAMLRDLAVELTGIYPSDDAVRICPHTPNAGCECRKPSPKMLTEMVEAFGHPRRASMYVGDLDTDRQAAEAAGIPFVWAWEFCGKTREQWVEWLAMRAAV